MSNLHSKQTGSQVHKPRKLSDAEAQSLMIVESSIHETDGLDVGYIYRGVSHSTEITTEADVSGSLHNSYFICYGKNNKDAIAFYLSVIGQTAAFIKPDNCAGVYNMSIANNASTTECAARIKASIDEYFSNDYISSIASNVVTFVYTARKKIDSSNIVWSSVITTSTEPSVDQIMISDQSDSGNLKFIDLNEAVADVVGAMVSGNTETNITVTYDDADNTLDFVATGGSGTPEGTAVVSTGELVTKFLRADGDGTCSWQVPTVDLGDRVESVRLANGSAAGTVANGDVTLEFLGGTGITTSVSGTRITISESLEKKSKSDIDSLTGVAGNDLGTFTGGTIGDGLSIKDIFQAIETRIESIVGAATANLGVFSGGTINDSSDIKQALQELETKGELLATDSVKGIATFDENDFTVTSGDVKLAKSYHTNSLRYSANNLVGTNNTSGTNPAWIFTEENNNKSNLFYTACDTSAMNHQIAGKGCIEVAVNGVTTKLVGGSLIGSGENSSTYKITLWKADLDSATGNVPMTLMGTFAITGSQNTDTNPFNVSLGSVDDCTLADGDGVVILMEDVEEMGDVDVRGTVTLRFEDTF